MKKFLIKKVKGFLSPERYERFKRFCLNVISVANSRDLKKLATIWWVDKWNDHWYVEHYQKYFQPLRKRKLNIFEIGVGGYGNPAAGGASLRMWKYYFPRSRIFSIDIYDKHLLEEKRIKIFKGSQSDRKSLEDIFQQIGSLDIIIDDGSHINEDIVNTFKILFPLLKSGGIYVVEDIQTSYWPQFGGDSENLNNPVTAMNYFKNLADSLNYMEFMKAGYEPTYFDKNIIAIHFYHNLIFIKRRKR